MFSKEMKNTKVKPYLWNLSYLNSDIFFFAKSPYQSRRMAREYLKARTSVELPLYKLRWDSLGNVGYIDEYIF